MMAAESTTSPGAAEHRPHADDIGPSSPLRLIASAQLLEGPDGKPMLGEGEQGGYLLLGRGAAALVPTLRKGTTYTELLDQVMRTSGLPTEEAERRLHTLLDDMRQSKLLEGVVPRRMDIASRLARSQLKAPYLRLPLSRNRADRMFELMANSLHRAPVRRCVLPALWMGAPLACLFAILTLIRNGLTMPPAGGTLLVILPVITLQLCLHESAHGVCCRYYGVPIREVGLAVWCYIFPIAYVNCSDSYRLPRRWPRVAISLAGPLVDMYACGVIALLAGHTRGGAQEVWQAALMVQLASLLLNFNLLLPTDGSHALEAATGQMNLRGRSISYVLHRLLRRPLPSGLTLSRHKGERLLAWGYGVACLAYMLVMFAGTGYLLSMLVRGV